MKISSIMTKDVVSVGLDDPLSKVKKIFEQTNFHHLLVMEGDRLYGVVSERDLLKAISPNIGLASETDKDTATLNKRVHQAMTRKPVVVLDSADVMEAVHLFNHNTLSCLPVKNTDDNLVGILTWRDLLKALEAVHNRKIEN